MENVPVDDRIIAAHGTICTAGPCAEDYATYRVRQNAMWIPVTLAVLIFAVTGCDDSNSTVPVQTPKAYVFEGAYTDTGKAKETVVRLK